MGVAAWILVLGIIVGLAYWAWHTHRRWEERNRASEARMAQMMVQSVRPSAAPGASATPAAPAVSGPQPQERLLLEAAGKAAEAGEPALAIQLYARVISRFPGGPSAALARTAVEAQKKRLALR